MTILFAFLVVGILGALLGIGLAFASRVFEVRKDRQLERLEAALPGLNCGACGFAGCVSYAQAVAAGEAPLTLCTPGGPGAAEELGTIMGVEVDVPATRMVTQVHCRGGRDVSEYAFEYDGLADCNAVHLLYGGDKVCKTSCLGLGTCIRVCPVDAIYYDSEAKVWVDRDLCISCGKCIDVCPTGVMKWVPYDADYIVACNNTEPGRVVRKHCKVGCIGCHICEKKSPAGGFVVENELAAIDYAAKGSRSAGAQKCPTNCIIPVGPMNKVTSEAKPAATPVATAAGPAAEVTTRQDSNAEE